MSKKAKPLVNGSVINLNDAKTGQTLAFFGNGLIEFQRSLTTAQIQAISKLLKKKKFNRYIEKEKFEKAQEFANKKFAQV